MKPKSVHFSFLAFAIVVVVASIDVISSKACAQSKNTEHTLKLDENQKGIDVEVQSLDWLVGRWVGEGLGGDCEETFLPVWNGELMGTFRMAQGGKLVFSEFFAVVKQDGVASLKLKHFNPDMTSWEEKDKTTTFTLIKVEKNAAYFSGLTYKLETPDSLKVWVAMKNAKGQLNEAEFSFKRATDANQQREKKETSESAR